MAFTAKDVQALREKTGCGMMDCKKALTESGGDMEKAMEYLREKGLAAAAKKASRIAAEGIVEIFVSDDENTAVAVEVNSETDFVAKNADFQSFVKAIAKIIAEKKPASVDALLALPFEGALTVADGLREKILTIGENLSIRRFEIFEGKVVSYVHGGGRIGVMVQVDAPDEVFAKQEAKDVVKDVAMQIAAINPLYLNASEVPADIIEKEKEILIAQIKNDEKNKSKPTISSPRWWTGASTNTMSKTAS
jgi:elongation factor Ts